MERITRIINRMDDRLAKIAKDGKANASRLQDLSGLQNVGWRKLDINIAGKAYWIKYRILLEEEEEEEEELSYSIRTAFTRCCSIFR